MTDLGDASMVIVVTAMPLWIVLLRFVLAKCAWHEDVSTNARNMDLTLQLEKVSSFYPKVKC